jgi:hypothetical protein
MNSAQKSLAIAGTIAAALGLAAAAPPLAQDQVQE